MKFLKYIPLVKVDEKTRTAYGIATAEVIDSDDEICDYPASVPLYQQWSQQALESTVAAGQEPSLGNIRLMHQLIIGGKVNKIDFDDAAKQIYVGSEPASDEIYGWLKKGLIRGYSQGGTYLWRRCNVCASDIPPADNGSRSWDCPKCQKKVVVRYAARVSEVSYVDSPALPIATFSFVKANGSVELVKFADRTSESELPAQPQPVKPAAVVAKKEVKLKKDARTKTVAGESLPSSAFAYVGDPDKTETWKFPIKFSSDDKSTRHIRNALARFGQAKGIPEEDKSKVRARIVAAARRHGIDVGDEESKAAKACADYVDSVLKNIDASRPRRPADMLSKSLYDVQGLITAIQNVHYCQQSCAWEAEWEQDDRDDALAVELQAAKEHLAEIIRALIDEELDEITAHKAVSGATVVVGSDGFQKGAIHMADTNNDLTKKAKSMAAHFRKAADEHEKMAAIHKAMGEESGAMMEAHKAKMDHHASCMGKADVGDDHKEAHSFHKAMSGSHKDMAKRHGKLEESHKAMVGCMTKAAEGYEAGADAPESGQPKNTSDKAATGDVNKAADPVVAPAAAAPVASESELTKATSAITAFASSLDSLKTTLAEIPDLKKGLTDLKTAVDGIMEKAIVPNPGVAIPRVNGAADPAPISSNDPGF